jgi:acyl carrier protein phosphodiesterase
VTTWDNEARMSIRTIRGRKAQVLDVTADSAWTHLLERVWKLDVEGRRPTDEFVSLTYDDQFWALGDPPKIYQVVEWL